MNYFINIMSSKKARMVIMVIAIALFVISAAAPSATIGIGK
jgi:hypothetical protein